MPLSLSVPEFLSQHPDLSIKQQAVRSPWTIPLYDPTGRSHGYRQEINLRTGLSLLVDDYTLKEDLYVETGSGQACEPALELELSFMLSGHNHLEGVPSRHNFLAASWDDTDGGRFHWQAGERVLKFDIHMEAGLLETLLGRQLENLPPSFRQLCQSDRTAIGQEACPSHQRFWQVTSTTLAMRSAVQQLLNCPYEGPTRWLYWEGKVLELIALRLEQASDRTNQSEQKASSQLQSDDIDRIYFARDILLQQLTNPPLLLELARLVGLNDYKLKKGFRQVFGTTVFGYLTQQRMKKARQLLVQQQSIAAVATAVGYESPTAFSGAFKRQVGMSPKGYQLGKCRVVS
ncbi:MAG: helix-turn-helix transcriptional regulator [Phormidesmis sp. RL_2_1]|nr:helix-turn-helix transcriptional regulator [Phormidesmis sp. RL_2_1]